MTSSLKAEIEKTRLETFCDGVIAIVMTLMALELRPLMFSDHKMFINLSTFFTEVGPSALIYFISFATIAIMWVNHHHMFLYLEKMDTRFLWLNIGLLFWMSMIPMPTALLGRNLGDPAATLIYGLVMSANTAWFMLLRKSSHRFAHEKFTVSHQRKIDRVNRLSTLAYLVGTLLVFLSPWVSLAFYIIIPLVYFRPERLYGKSE